MNHIDNCLIFQRDICSFIPIVIFLRFDFVPHALAFQCSAVFLPIPTLDKRLSASLAKGNVGFAAVVIQGVGIHRNKSSKAEICRIHDGFDHRLNLDLPGGNIIFQSHLQFRYVLDKILQHQGTVNGIRPVPRMEQIFLIRHTDFPIDPLRIDYFAFHQTADSKESHGVGVKLFQILYHVLHGNAVAFDHIDQYIPVLVGIITGLFQRCNIIPIVIVRMNILQTPTDQDFGAFLQRPVPEFQIQITQFNQQLLPGRIPLIGNGTLLVPTIFRTKHDRETSQLIKAM